MTDPLTARLRLLTSLSEDDLHRLERARSTTVSYAAKASIMAEDESPDHLHILIEGWAARSRELQDGRRQYVSLLLPGDLCDIDGLLLRRVHLGVAALTPCVVALVPHTRLRALLDERPPVRDVFWWLTFVENAISAEWSAGLGRRTAVERFAHLICELLVRLAPVDMTEGNAYELPLTQEQLSYALGLSAVHLSRTTNELRGSGLLSFTHHRITIHNWDALKALAGFSTNYLHVEGLRPGSRAAKHH